MTTEKNNIYDGEKYDARQEDDWDHPGFDDSSWLSTSQATVTLPGTKLRASMAPPMKVISTIIPTMKQLFPGIYVFDMGQNITGWAQLHLKGKRGDRVDMRFGEELATLWNNYTYDADVTILEKSAGLSFRIVDENNLYVWKFTSAGRLVSLKKVNGVLFSAAGYRYRSCGGHRRFTSELMPMGLASVRLLMVVWSIPSWMNICER